MINSGLLDAYGEKYLFATYIMSERRRRPEERKFGHLLNSLPHSCRNYPFFFDEDELKMLDGTTLQEELVQLKAGVKRTYDDICEKVPEYK